MAGDFSTNVYPKFENVDNIYNNCNSTVEQYLSEAINAAIADLISYGIHDINEDNFISVYLSPYISWDTDFQIFVDNYMEIILKAEDLDQYRTQRRQNRNKWVGGGFGLGGAIKGSAQAAALNAATGIMHGAWNLGAKAISSIDSAIKKKRLYRLY